jgi:hypothetical protein
MVALREHRVLGFTHTSWANAMRRACTLSRTRRETVKFGYNRASDAWVFFTGAAVKGLTHISSASCPTKKGRK